jgi:hypothetical protein
MAMFALILTILPACGCSQRHILRMSSPELSTTVSFFDKGPTDSDDDDTTIVLDEPKRIAKVAAFFEARTDKWKPLDAESRRKRQTTISFRKGDQTTDRFWLERDRICLQDPAGDCWTCDLSDAERAELKNYFHFTTNFKSDG